MAPVGFLAPRNAAAPAVEDTNKTLPIFHFDSGSCIHMNEAVNSTLVLGSTGSGKTHSVLLPMSEFLIRAGYGGIIIDVKGNLRASVLALASSCGRADDVVEFGSAPTATPTNLLEGMTSGERRQFFDSLNETGVKNDNNIAWAMKGGRMAADVADVLEVLAQHFYPNVRNSIFTPTLERIHALLTNWDMASIIWDIYTEVKEAYNLASPQYRPYFTINMQTFHVFHALKYKESKRDIEEFDKQVSWMLQMITMQLENMQHAGRGLMTKFSSLSSDAVCMDYKREIYENNRIVLVHFSPDCGKSGEILSRVSKNRFYQALYANGMQLPPDKYTFFVGDEFQGIINVNDTEGNDVDLFSVSREFRNINLIATQSLSSLFSKTDREFAVYSLIANCTNVVCLRTTDVKTLEWLRKSFPENLAPDCLESGECVVRRYNAQSRTTKEERSSVNGAFARTQALINSAVPEPKPLESLEPETTDTCGTFPADLYGAWLSSLDKERGEPAYTSYEIVEYWVQNEKIPKILHLPSSKAQKVLKRREFYA